MLWATKYIQRLARLEDRMDILEADARILNRRVTTLERGGFGSTSEKLSTGLYAVGAGG